MSDIIENNSPSQVLDGSDIPLSDYYTLYSHAARSNTWELSSYEKMITLYTVSDYWKFMNNFYKLDTKLTQYFLMKNNITPRWEDDANRNGGKCSFKLEHVRSIELWEDLCSRMICDVLTSNKNDINGVTYCPKNSYVIIQIWNSDGNNDISNMLPTSMSYKYKDINPQYKKIEPED